MVPHLGQKVKCDSKYLERPPGLKQMTSLKAEVKVSCEYTYTKPSPAMKTLKTGLFLKEAATRKVFLPSLC